MKLATFQPSETQFRIGRYIFNLVKRQFQILESGSREVPHFHGYLLCDSITVRQIHIGVYLTTHTHTQTCSHTHTRTHMCVSTCP